MGRGKQTAEKEGGKGWKGKKRDWKGREGDKEKGTRKGRGRRKNKSAVYASSII